MTLPRIGTTVHYFPGEHDTDAHSNGLGADDPIAAVITRAWGDHCVNLTILPDNGGPTTRSSVMEEGSTGTASTGRRWKHIV